MIVIPTTTVYPGTIGHFDVLVTNTDPTAIDLGGFTIDLSLPMLSGAEFLDARTTTTDVPYLFSGATAVDPGGIPFSFDTFPGSTLIASDLSLLASGEALGAGETRALARVTFQLAESSIPGSSIGIVLGDFTGLSDPLGTPIDYTHDIGSILVRGAATVPEPSCLTTAGLVALIGSVLFRRRYMTCPNDRP